MYSTKYHLVCCPKYRRRVLVDGVDERLKGRSSGLLRLEFPWLRRLPSPWTESWCVSIVGGAPLEVVVRRYVGNQKLVS